MSRRKVEASPRAQVLDNLMRILELLYGDGSGEEQIRALTVATIDLIVKGALAK